MIHVLDTYASFVVMNMLSRFTPDCSIALARIGSVTLSRNEYRDERNH